MLTNSNSAIVFLITCLTLLLCSMSSHASHVVGGNLEMTRADNVPGHFRIALNMYFDEINQNVGGAPEAKALLYVYRKSDNKRITSLYIPGLSKQAINYTNQACATIRQIKTSLYRYEGTVNWNPADYNDQAGYYITWQYCCRNGDIDNIAAPAQTGETFYLEFPALTQNGKIFSNSSPVFDQVDGEYLCINDPFTFSFNAKDADGDVLQYYLDTPFDRLDPNLGVGSTNGLNIRWLPDFSADKAIPGNPPLSINKQTGELSVTPNKLGLFVFTVIVEEYRGGKKIGLVRRDYQLFVVDCPPTAPPDPTITLNNKAITEIQTCEGKTVELKAAANTNWDYQWKKDGNNIVGATSPTLSVTETGVYQLVTSLKAQCSKSRRSVNIKVTVTKSRFKLTSQDPLRLCGSVGAVRLESLSGVAMTYQWYMDGKPLSESSSVLTAKQPGQYWAVVRDYVQGCTSYSDTVQLVDTPLPVAIITSQRTTTTICPNDSLTLSTSYQANYIYQWLFNGNLLKDATGNTMTARQAGQYSVLVTDTTTCQSISPPFNLSVVTGITITLDSIATLCGTDHPPITLKGSPSGGIFSGPGVSGDQYDPQLAGIGTHVIKYAINSYSSCQNAEAKRLSVIQSPPTVNLGPDLTISKGSSAQLHSGANGNYQYIWMPQANLINPTSSDPEATPEKTTSYTLTVSDNYGCSTVDSIIIYVYERIWVPDTFTPNGDGINDSWELRGIESYPQAEVTVFNRWGEVVFFSKQYKKPFDGSMNSSPLPLGMYIYQIKPSPLQPALRGSLMIIN